MTRPEIAVIRRSLFIEMIVAAIIKAHPKWRIDRRTLSPLGLDHVYEVVLRCDNLHHIISFDLSHDSLEGIRRKFHSAEASFAYWANPTHAIALTTLPTPDMVEVPEPREIVPFPGEDLKVVSWATIIIAAVLVVTVAVSFCYFAWTHRPY